MKPYAAMQAAQARAASMKTTQDGGRPVHSVDGGGSKQYDRLSQQQLSFLFSLCDVNQRNGCPGSDLPAHARKLCRSTWTTPCIHWLAAFIQSQDAADCATLCHLRLWRRLQPWLGVAWVTHVPSTEALDLCWSQNCYRVGQKLHLNIAITLTTLNTFS